MFPKSPARGSRHRRPGSLIRIVIAGGRAAADRRARRRRRPPPDASLGSCRLDDDAGGSGRISMSEHWRNAESPGRAITSGRCAAGFARAAQSFGRSRGQFCAQTRYWGPNYIIFEIGLLVSLSAGWTSASRHVQVRLLHVHDFAPRADTHLPS